MTSFFRHFVLGAASVSAVIAVSGITSSAQESASELYLDVSTGLNYYDNYESLKDPSGPTTLWGTDFVLGYASETRNQKLAFTTGIRFELGDFAEEPDKTSQWINPFAVLAYQRTNSTSLFRTDLSYRERDNGISVDEDFDSSTDLIVDQGTRSDARGEIELATGRGTPTWAEVELSFHRRRYFDTEDPGLTDRDIFAARGEVGLGITRTASLLLTARYSDRDDIPDVNEDRVRTAIGVGLQADIAPDFSFRGEIRHERNETTRTRNGDRVTTVEEEPTLSLRFEKDRPDGVLTFSVDGELESNGVRTTARVGRQMELRSGNLGFSIGATRLPEGDINPVGNIDWDRSYRTRRLSLFYATSVNTDDNGNDFLRNRLSFNFFQELTSLDGLQLTMAVSAADDLGDGRNEFRQAGASVSYIRDINRDLSFVTGYRHSYYVNDVDETTTENQVFARIDKNFSFRP